jgi:hypothetical protein
MRIEAAKNETSYQNGPMPHFNTMLYSTPLPSGRIPVVAQMQMMWNEMRTVALNPVTNTLIDYGGEEGLLPSIAPVDAGWVRSQIAVSVPTLEPMLGIYAMNGTGQLIYADGLDQRILLCKELKTGEVTELTRAIEGWIALLSFSN